jgi:apolipoprotein N-acyltransferase
MWLRIGWLVQSITQLWRFVATVALPALAAWAILRAGSARARIEGQVLLLDQRHQRIEIPLASITGLRAWRMPLPGDGIDLLLASGQRWTRSLVLARTQSLQALLVAAGAPLRSGTRLDAALLAHAQARGDAMRPWLDHALVKFVLFPLLPALVAFRLHQVIAFGGTFGEYHSYGLAAYLAGLLIWWVSWSMGLVLFAAVLRIAIEITVALAQWLHPAGAAAVRDLLEWAGRLAFYVGVPGWLVLRLLSG